MTENLFKWRHFEKETILLCVRWHLKYPLSSRNLVKMRTERGIGISHTTVMRWVHKYSPISDERIRKNISPTNDSWGMDETYIRIKGKNAYFYRTVDSTSETIDFYVPERFPWEVSKKERHAKRVCLSLSLGNRTRSTAASGGGRCESLRDRERSDTLSVQ